MDPLLVGGKPFKNPSDTDKLFKFISSNNKARNGKRFKKI